MVYITIIWPIPTPEHFTYEKQHTKFDIFSERYFEPWRQLHIFTSVPNITKGKQLIPNVSFPQ